MTVDIPEDRIATQVRERLDELRKTVRIDGFRQGKAPMTVVKQRFGKQVREEIVGEVLQSTFGEAMAKEELRPAGQPVIDPVNSDPGSGLSYTASFEVFPEVELNALSDLKITRETCEIGDDDINEMVEKLRDQNKEWVAVERAAADGDQLSIDFEGSIDGEVFEGGSGQDFEIQLGSGMMIDGFEDGLRGKSADDEVELDLKFPDEYRNEELAGKAVKFKIKILKVSEAVLPELDGAFYEKFGVSDGDETTFRTEVKQNMERERERAVSQRFSNAVTDQLLAAHEFEVPSALVESESERLAQQMAQEMMMRGMNPDQAAAAFADNVRDQAEKRVKLGLLMAEIIKTSELKADPDKVREKIEAMAAGYEDAAAVVKYYYDNPEHLQQVESLVLEEQAVNWIADQATVTETPISFDALMNPVQTDDNAEASS